MFDGLPIRFEDPVFLLLLLLVIPIWFIARLGSAGQSSGKFWTSFVVRSLLIALLSVALARPSVVEQGKSLTLMVVADVSRSIPRAMQRQSQEFLAQVEAAKQNAEDRIGVVSTMLKRALRPLLASLEVVLSATWNLCHIKRKRTVCL